MRVILKRKYTNYKDGLKELKIESLEKRRENLCLRFAKKCLKNEKVKDFFPKKKQKHKMIKRKVKKFKINNAKTKRYSNSAIPYMQRLLNKENEKKERFKK